MKENIQPSPEDKTKKHDSLPQDKKIDEGSDHDIYEALRAIGFKFGTKEDEGPFWMPKNRSVI